MPNLFRHPVSTTIGAMRLQEYYVYILTNDRNTVNYIGVTNDLSRRMYEHSSGAIKGFTSQYNVKKLVYFERCDIAEQAIAREKQLKNWHKEWKMNLVKGLNPELRDIYEDIVGIPKQVRDDGNTSVRDDE